MDQADTHLMGGQLDTPGITHGLNRRFTGGISRHHRWMGKGRHRGIDQDIAALTHDGRQCRPDCVEDAKQIDLNTALPSIWIHVSEWPKCRDPGVGKYHVDMAKASKHLGHCSLHGRQIGDVSDKRQSICAALKGDLCQGLGIAVK